MKSRFLRIFDRWNKRNAEYYKESFEKLDGNKLTFNFAAAFGNVLWLIYRKMYGWAMLVTLINAGIQIPMRMLSSTPSGLSGISILSFLIWFLGFGFFGNTFYYKHVKSQGSRGYTKMPDYNAIDPIWSLIVFGVVVPCLLGILSGIMLMIGKGSVPVNSLAVLSVLLQVLILSIPRTIDQKKFREQESSKPIKVTKKSIDQFLEKSDSKHMGTAVVIWFVSIVLSMLVTGYMAMMISSAGEHQPMKNSQSLTDFLRTNSRPTIDDESFEN
jgi:hypothetical protein